MGPTRFVHVRNGPRLASRVGGVFADGGYEVVAVLVELGLAHATDLQEGVAVEGHVGRHLAQRRVAEDDEGGHIHLVRYLLAKGAQLLKEGRVEFTLDASGGAVMS